MDTLDIYINGYQSNKPLGMLNDIQDFRISLAGAQEKAALLFYDSRFGFLFAANTPPTLCCSLAWPSKQKPVS